MFSYEYRMFVAWNVELFPIAYAGWSSRSYPPMVYGNRLGAKLARDCSCLNWNCYDQIQDCHDQNVRLLWPTVWPRVRRSNLSLWPKIQRLSALNVTKYILYPVPTPWLAPTNTNPPLKKTCVCTPIRLVWGSLRLAPWGTALKVLELGMEFWTFVLFNDVSLGLMTLVIVKVWPLYFLVLKSNFGHSDLTFWS